MPHDMSGPPPTKRVMYRAEPVEPTRSETELGQEFERGFDEGRRTARLDYLHPCYAQGAIDALRDVATSDEYGRMSEWCENFTDAAGHETWEALRRKIEDIVAAFAAGDI